MKCFVDASVIDRKDEFLKPRDAVIDQILTECSVKSKKAYPEPGALNSGSDVIIDMEVRDYARCFYLQTF